MIFPEDGWPGLMRSDSVSYKRWVTPVIFLWRKGLWTWTPWAGQGAQHLSYYSEGIWKDNSGNNKNEHFYWAVAVCHTLCRALPTRYPSQQPCYVDSCQLYYVEEETEAWEALKRCPRSHGNQVTQWKNHYIQMCDQLARGLQLIRHLEDIWRHAPLTDLANNCASVFNKVGAHEGDDEPKQHFLSRCWGWGRGKSPTERCLGIFPHRAPGVTIWKLYLLLTR